MGAGTASSMRSSIEIRRRPVFAKRSKTRPLAERRTGFAGDLRGQH